MNALSYIQARQRAWARATGIEIASSKVGQGAPNYTLTSADNLFIELDETIIAELTAGDGGELTGGESLPKIQALHSSSALGLNVFNYWRSINDPVTIASLLKLVGAQSKAPESIKFEVKFPIADKFEKGPNMDVVIHNRAGEYIHLLAIECKFTEAYGSRKHEHFKTKYFDSDLNIWEGLSHLRNHAELLSVDSDQYEYLDAGQLIKHILGLKRSEGLKGFKLMYLWYDALGVPGATHRAEVERFAEIANQDGVSLYAMTYQELIVRMINQLGPEHDEYVSYLTARYL